MDFLQPTSWGDALALRAAMQSSIDDPRQAAAEMQQRLAHVTANFSLARMAGDIESLYQRLLTQS